MGLLNERQRFDEIDHLTHVLRDQGAALNEVTIVRALDAMSKRDFEQGLASLGTSFLRPRSITPTISPSAEF